MSASDVAMGAQHCGGSFSLSMPLMENVIMFRRMLHITTLFMERA